MTIGEIKIMSTIERLKVMEELWDSLSHEEKECESPDWHGSVLKERKKKIEKGEGEFISLEKLKLRDRK
ncbi:addiction module protein [Candidatus Desantisbacteria bacterium]|nr:addiction module protein [Candidatus Desantisbacteria bacterium]